MEELREALKNAKRIVICGIGNDIRGDDSFGVYIAEKLKRVIKKANILVLNCGEVPENYTGKILNFHPDLIIFIDAVNFGGKPGEIIITDPENTEGAGVSTHSLPLKFLATYLKANTNAKTILIGCQPKNIGLFEDMSEEVKAVAEVLLKFLYESLELS
ncbi:hydrogenase maturation peptidase HycI [Pyrococcus furiosus DSM 3638]|uniref:Hydrogenase maturation peptidase HycI n=3 Tax=Pyrococcus furiosus TaxID=2261 RepID=A0A5C0XNU2_PYRFU|nr:MULTISPECIES: hydrogenase maturation peptidase HycI [Pyrococcus]AAL80741.1 hydrogenase maturation protease [Pyrococcus furiosus DSM 3638]AFN03410.1 hydrogenase maturation protease HycI [Pyrococcus furiosus COM1]MDK2869628.1 hydrogenase 3 maturation protease [Pyrococcus sp.]QEK78322.1 hydrogenase maturation peptidase HycI [Pyrococcus furiosus DSM 3638]